MGGVPKIRGTVLGIPIARIIVFWDLYWGLLFRETIGSRLSILKLNIWKKGPLAVIGLLGNLGLDIYGRWDFHKGPGCISRTVYPFFLTEQHDPAHPENLQTLLRRQNREAQKG